MAENQTMIDVIEKAIRNSELDCCMWSDNSIRELAEEISQALIAGLGCVTPNEYRELDDR